MALKRLFEPVTGAPSISYQLMMASQGHLNCQEEDMLLLNIGFELSLLSATPSNLVKIKTIISKT